MSSRRDGGYPLQIFIDTNSMSSGGVSKGHCVMWSPFPSTILTLVSKLRSSTSLLSDTAKFEGLRSLWI